MSSFRLCDLGQVPSLRTVVVVFFSLQLCWNDLGRRRAGDPGSQIAEPPPDVVCPLAVSAGGLRPCCHVSGLCLVRSWEQVTLAVIPSASIGRWNELRTPVLSTIAFSHWALWGQLLLEPRAEGKVSSS